MTAEVAVMNKLAVALAADSAVTVASPRGNKVYNSVNKLFRLSECHPVGIMVFGGADFMGIPWETIIKSYRKQLGTKCFAYVKDYRRDFQEYIRNNRTLFPARKQQEWARHAVRNFLRFIHVRLLNAVTELFEIKGSATETDVKEQLKKVLEEWVNTFKGIGQADCIPDGHRSSIKKKYSGMIREEIRRVFQKVPFGRGQRNRLESLCVEIFTANAFHSGTTGVVVAGFGEEETYPALCWFETGEVLEDVLRYGDKESTAISDQNRSAILPFAQIDMVATFMEGMDPWFGRFLSGHMKEFFLSLSKELGEQLKGIAALPNATRVALAKSVAAVGKASLKSFNEELVKQKDRRHVRAILDTVAILPKDELAAMAESLINVTSLKRRISLDTETVGGPIDVAVISKGDGFIYLKHKHYFDPALNPHFFSKH